MRTHTKRFKINNNNHVIPSPVNARLLIISPDAFFPPDAVISTVCAHEFHHVDTQPFFKIFFIIIIIISTDWPTAFSPTNLNYYARPCERARMFVYCLFRRRAAAHARPGHRFGGGYEPRLPMIATV